MFTHSQWSYTNFFSFDKPFKFNDELGLQNAIKEKQRPEFDEQFSKKYRELIEKCWCECPKDRPTFSEIVDMLKSEHFLEGLEEDDNSIDTNTFLDYCDFVDAFDETIEGLSKEELNKISGKKEEFQLFLSIRKADETSKVETESEYQKTQVTQKKLTMKK